VTVFCGASPGREAAYTDAAAALGHSLGERGIGLVFGGSSDGLMGALSSAARASGAHTTGVFPRSLGTREREDLHVDDLLLVESLLERKIVMANRADAFIALPGGVGTLEELTEQWSRARMGLHDKPCALMNTAGFYDGFIGLLETMHAEGFRSADGPHLIVRDDAAEVLPAALAAAAPLR
jgi:uncharacterized protein (TIGR00730 family)